MLFILLAVVVMTASAMAQNEIGIIAGGINGLSYKHWFSERGALQMDLAVGLTAAPMGIYVNGTKTLSGTTLEINSISVVCKGVTKLLLNL